MDKSIERLERQVESLAKEQADIEVTYARELARLESEIEAHATGCPYRETIARAANNIIRLAEIEKRITAVGEESLSRDNAIANQLHDLQLKFAGNPILGGASGGGMVAIAGGVIFGIGKGLGWW